MHLPLVTICVVLTSLLISSWPFWSRDDAGQAEHRTLAQRASWWMALHQHWVAASWALLIVTTWQVEHGQPLQRVISGWWPSVVGGVVGWGFGTLAKYAHLAWKRRHDEIRDRA